MTQLRNRAAPPNQDSRTEARRWIAEGRVAVNGKVLLAPDVWVDPARDRVKFDRRLLRAERKIYLLLYKPKGYVTTYKDSKGRPTVYDLLTDVREWVFPLAASIRTPLDCCS